MEDHVVGDDEGARLELLAREREQLLVEPVGSVEEDDVEHVVDRAERLARVALDEQRCLLEPRVADVPPQGEVSTFLCEQRSLLATLPETTFFGRYRETFSS